MYTTFYGLLENPFEITLDPKFLYFSDTYQEVLDTTIKSIRSRAVFASITGEVGTGKTMLTYSIFMRLAEMVKAVFIFHPPRTLPELIKNILQELDQQIVATSKEALLKQLNEYLCTRLGADEILAVFIDEAQNLPEEVMEGLGKLQEVIPQILNRLRIIFVGQTGLEDKMNSPAMRHLNQRLGTKSKIRALTDEESRKYIDHRLKIAGSNSSHIFTPDAISMIVRHAQGVPRVINILCDNALLTGYGLSRRKVDEDIIRKVIKEMEGPISKKSTPSKIVMTLKRFHWVPLRHCIYQRKVVFFTLLLLCLGGGLIFLLYGTVKQKPTKTWSIESIKKREADVEAASREPLHPTAKPETVAGSLPPGQEEHILEVTTVQKGQTLSLLAQKYYHFVHPTVIDLLLDFNPEITNMDLIQVNQRIKIPEIRREWLVGQSPNHTWKIHVGTFGATDFIETYKNEPAFKGKRIEILRRKVSPTVTWYRVLVGDFDNKDDAFEVVNLLKEKGLLPIFWMGQHPA